MVKSSTENGWGTEVGAKGKLGAGGQTLFYGRLTLDPQ